MRTLVCCFFIFASALVASAQDMDRIRFDPEMVWAQGGGKSVSAADKVALKELCLKLSPLAGFDLPESRRDAVMLTFLADVRRISHMIASEGLVLRYVSRDEIPLIFAPREKKAEEFSDAGYYEWTWYCYASLPGDHSGLLHSLESKLQDSAIPQRRLDYLRKEVDAIKGALGKSPVRAKAVTEAEQKAGPVKEEVAPPSERYGFTPVSGQVPDMKNVAAETESTVSTIGFRRVQETPLDPGKREEIHVVPAADIGIMPEFCPGLEAELFRGKTGVYISISGNMKSGRNDFACSSTDAETLYLLWPVRKETVSYWQFSTGVSMAFNEKRRLAVTAGAGYGRRQVIWQMVTGDRVLIRDISSSGLVLEAGLRFSTPSTGRVVFHALAGTLAFRTAGLRLGAGYMF